MYMFIPRKIRLLMVLGALLLVSFSSLSLFSYLTARSSLQDEIVNSSLPLLRENIYSDIQKDLLPASNIASAMAHDAFLVSWIAQGESDLPAITRYLEKIRQEYGYFSVFFVSAKTQRYYHFSGITKTISSQDSHDGWFYTFRDSDKQIDLDVDTNEAAGGKLTVFINNRVTDSSGTFLGVTGVGLEMRDISESLRQKQRQYHRTIYMTDDMGLVTAHPDPENVLVLRLSALPGLKDIAPKLLEKNGLPQNFTYQAGSNTYHVASRYIPELNWFLLVEQEEGASLAPARISFYITLFSGIGVSILILFLSALTISGFTRRLEDAAATDELTGAANRRQFNETIAMAQSRFERTGQAHALILFDIDHFKTINDRQGHLEGDRILRTMSTLCRKILRPTDFFFRWGGDEFAAIIEGGVPEAELLMKRFQSAIAAAPDWKGPAPTISLGAAAFAPGDTQDDLVRRADHALYKAKSEGRNRYTV